MNIDWFSFRLTFYALRQEAPCFFAGADTFFNERGPEEFPPGPIQHHRNLIFPSILDRLKHP
jgi:hypothetical protein